MASNEHAARRRESSTPPATITSTWASRRCTRPSARRSPRPWRSRARSSRPKSWSSLPKMKTHVATGITGAVKNTFGHLVGGEKTRLHRAAVGPENFARAVVDVFQVRPPDLVIMDAVVAMEGQGPSGGRPRPVGRLLASDRRGRPRHRHGRHDGPGPPPGAHAPDRRRARPGSGGPCGHPGRRPAGGGAAGFRVPPIGMRFGALLARLGSAVLVARPEVRHARCTRCGSCVQACPVEAITMTRPRPGHRRGPVHPLFLLPRDVPLQGDDLCPPHAALPPPEPIRAATVRERFLFLSLCVCLP